MNIPTTTTIRARAADLIDTATRHGDTSAIAILDRVERNLAAGARLEWDLYDMTVYSANTLGAVYTVSCGFCTCPARKPCWHIAAYEIAIELLDDASDDADFESDADDLAIEWLVTGVEIGRRLCAARSQSPWATL